MTPELFARIRDEITDASRHFVNGATVDGEAALLAIADRYGREAVLETAYAMEALDAIARYIRRR